MLILPPGHHQAVAARRRLRPREKVMIAGVLGVLAAGIVALVISFGSTARTTRGGCVDVIVPGATGAEELYRCGADTRALCNSVGQAHGPSGVLGQAVARECRKVGLPVPR